MNPKDIIHELDRNGRVFESLFRGLGKIEYLWKPEPDSWCLLQVLCHLYDEEREDFRARTEHVLTGSDSPLPPIDPVGWVESRNYMRQDFDSKLGGFLIERRQSVDWLLSLENPNWKNSYKHPIFGKMTAQMLLANWLAHDYFHIRQISRIKYAYLEKKFGENLSYAGEW